MTMSVLLDRKKTHQQAESTNYVVAHRLCQKAEQNSVLLKCHQSFYNYTDHD